MINVQTTLFVTIYAVLWQSLFCCHLRCIGAKSILPRFPHFCVEKKGQISGMGIIRAIAIALAISKAKAMAQARAMVKMMMIIVNWQSEA